MVLVGDEGSEGVGELGEEVERVRHHVRLPAQRRVVDVVADCKGVLVLVEVFVVNVESC